jgi:hypothetical protein
MMGQDRTTHAADLPDDESEIFLIAGLDAISRKSETICPSGKIG